MNTKLIMTVSAIFLALAGVILTFFPNEIANQIGIGSAKPAQLVVQILGALYFGFAMLNWTAKGSIIGGIYNKPLVSANLSHFLIGGLALIKGLSKSGDQFYVVLIVAGIYTIFAIVFGILFVRHPGNSTNA
ncbi:MAG: hypothetical protein ACXVB0_23355 [Mucilaginibacter sp.]